MSQELITGIFTLSGAVIGGLLSKYGIPFFTYHKDIEYKGRGKDVNLANVVEGFEDNNIYTYEIDNFIVQKSKSKINYKGRFIAHKNDESIEWITTGEGVLSNGVAYCQCSTKSHLPGIHWGGVMSMVFANGGKIYGSWITENINIKGKMVFGIFELHAK